MMSARNDVERPARGAELRGGSRAIAAALLAGLLASACGESERELVNSQAGIVGPAAEQEAPPVADEKTAPAVNEADHNRQPEAAALASRVTFCRIPDPSVPSSAFEIFEAPPNERGDYWVRYTCREACSDWRDCTAPAHLQDGGEMIMHGRAPDRPKPALAFVVDDMGGHLVFSEDGDKTVFIHAGAGGTRHYAEVAEAVERHSDARTAMVRWDTGFVGDAVQPPFEEPVRWGWYSRTTPEGTTIPELNRRVAAIMAWTHEHLSGEAMFATMGCSMGTNATFMPVLWHGLDPVVDYQLFVGGPNMWDLNAQCGRRHYEEGHCDLDPTVECREDADCAALGSDAHCRMPRPYVEINEIFDTFANHVHATDACDIAAAGPQTEPYPPFDDSSMAYVEGGDWTVDHPVDFIVNVGGDLTETSGGGDRYWALGDFMYIFNRIEPAENRTWRAIPDSDHCDAMTSGNGVDLLLERMDL